MEHTDTPAETQNPPQVASGYLTDKRIQRLTAIHPFIRLPSVGRSSPTDTPAETHNPPQVVSGYLTDKRIQRLTIIHPFIRLPSVDHRPTPRTRSPKPRTRRRRCAATAGSVEADKPAQSEGENKRLPKSRQHRKPKN
jgi:hypothetical protein